MDIAIFCLVAGVLFVCAEIFIPGGILGVLGTISLITSTVLAYKTLGPLEGTYFFIFALFLLLCVVMVSLKLLPKSWVGKRMFLSTSGKGYSSHKNTHDDLLGKTGEAYTDLRPVGVAVIEEKKYDVYAVSSFIEKGSKVEVIKVEANNIVVKIKED